MSSSLVKYILSFISLLLVQVVIFNDINFLGYVNPYIYIIFILLFPVRKNRFPLLITAFFLGFLVDVFSDSGGVHAAASVFLAYSRPVLLKAAYGSSYESATSDLFTIDFFKQIIYICISAFCHHLVLFTLEVFNLSSIWIILKRTIFSVIFTTILSTLLIKLFSNTKQ